MEQRWRRNLFSPPPPLPTSSRRSRWKLLSYGMFSLSLSLSLLSLSPLSFLFPLSPPSSLSSPPPPPSRSLLMVYLFNLIEEHQAQSPVKYSVHAFFFLFFPSFFFFPFFFFFLSFLL